MVPSELESFVKKFQQLWQHVLTAHLDLDTHAGNAWVGIRLQLGPAPGPLHHHQPFNQEVNMKTESPSRKRRRARREAARQAGAEMSSESSKDSVKVNTENTAEQVENVLVAKNVSDEVFPDDIDQVQKNIPQVDGASEELDIIYAFESEFAEEDVHYTLEEVLTKEIDVELIARVKVGEIRSAEYAY